MEKNNLELVKQLRHELHQHPELSNHESWTKNHLISFLKSHTSLKIVDKGLWFYAIYYAGKDKKNIAFHADIDAIPMEESIDILYASEFHGVAHKCGHDGHAATLAGFALEIDQKGSDKNIYFLFQHAEETGDGAAQCVSFIGENKIEEIFTYHNYSGMELKSVNVIDGISNYASKGMTINMEGSPSHASEPENGKNPAYAIAKIIDTIPEIVAPENNRGMVLCTVIQIKLGERAFGISASRGELLLTIRAFYESELDKLQKNLEDIAQAQGNKYGLKVSFLYNDIFPETANHKESSDKIRMTCQKKKLKVFEIKDAFRGSDDFGHYLKHTKGAICYIGNGEDYPMVHTPSFDFNDDIIETAVELFMGISEL